VRSEALARKLSYCGLEQLLLVAKLRERRHDPILTGFTAPGFTLAQLYTKVMDDLKGLAAALRARKVSSRELVTASLREIQRLNSKLNAFITVTGEAALKEAAARDEELARGIDRGPLHGIPIAHKDLMRTKGVRTTAGSKIFTDYVPQRDAAIVTKLREAGAISLGKTGLHELAYGITSNNPHFGAIHNPWHLARIPGGSSGGSAAAVAAGTLPFATGTDTGGSIRVPASFCGVVGLKPTFGRFNVSGVLPLGFSQDHLGPLTRTVRDAAIAFQAMAEDPSDYIPPADSDLTGLRVGFPKNFFLDRVDPEVEASIRAAFDTAAAAGARVVEVQVPDMEALRSAAVTCLLVEAASALRTFLDRRSDFGADVLAMLDQGKAISAIDYIEAQRTRRRIGRQFARLFHEVDCIFTPATPMTAPKIGQTTLEIGGATEEVRAAATRFTRGMNALGLPAISIPCGFSRSGLPIGLQIIAASRQEDRLLHAAAAMEDGMALSIRYPQL
jgi:aspartyl-tRNA(Asn)/glutamyl-tRNA(Gln) amidotransferase subunit A